MEITVNITKTITSDNKEFKIGDDIYFHLMRNDKIYDCFGVITNINEDTFEIDNVQLDKMNVSDKLTIKYSEIKDGMLHFTDNSWY